MFQKIIDLISNFFSSIFGKKKKEAPKKETTKKDKTIRVVPPSPSKGDLQDGSEVPVDTIVVVNEMEVEEGPLEIEETPSSPTDTPADSGSAGGASSGEDPATPSEPTAPTEPEKKGRYLWCLDNGHGIKQAGKRSPKFELNGKEVQLLEYEFNRDVVERIMKALKEVGVHFFDVVPDVLEVGSFLKERVERANKKASDLPKIYVSVHANAGPANSGEWVTPSISGIETWFHHNSKKGKKIAAIFQKKLVDKTGLKNRHLKSTKDRMLYVLKHTNMPAILTENGFYNNKTEAKKLLSNSMRQKVADAHVEAILEIEKNGL